MLKMQKYFPWNGQEDWRDTAGLRRMKWGVEGSIMGDVKKFVEVDAEKNQFET